MPSFHETLLGRMFFEGQFPQLVKAMVNLQKDVAYLARLKEEQLKVRQKELALKETEIHLMEREQQHKNEA